MIKKRTISEKPESSLSKLFKEYLKGEGLSYTSQREDIVNFIVKKRIHHFSVEELIEKLRKSGIRASRATVYRTVNHLILAGFLREVALNNSQMYYDFIPEVAHHEHLVCERCKRIVEFTDPALEESIEKVAKDANFSITKHTVQIFGICEKCIKENESKKK
ncbi:MAG: transcriptional repressor [Chitinispirillaceae bacterium]|nr:transcriptional repressor [Chitinispirillaceae bacterium]